MKMKKIVIYISFIAACVAVTIAFFLAKNYIQLIGAVLLYPPLVYFALKLFPRKDKIEGVKRQAKPNRVLPKANEKAIDKTVEVVDIDKRTFLKLIGATGLSFFVFSLLGKKVDSLLFGSGGTQQSQASSLDGVPGSASSSTSKYKISEVDDAGVIAYYGFTDSAGTWLIMKEDPDTGSFRYARGDSGFPANWARRATLKYDYFHNLF